MQILSGLATLAFVVVGALVGIRLLLLARRTRALPETSVGLALLLIGGIGYPMAIAGGTPGLLADAAGVRLSAAATCVVDLAFIAIAVFNWSVFRRQNAWARAAVAVLSVAYTMHALVTLHASTGAATSAELLTGHLRVTLAGQLLNSIVFAWTAFESYRYWWMLRRRAAIGLGDPVLTNRFLLWAVSATSSVLTNAISWWILVQGIDFFAHEGVQLAIGLFAVGSCTCQYLAFLPPRAYLARLRRTAAQPA
jgi:hypothetical protein